jgi:hypothetical protein
MESPQPNQIKPEIDKELRRLLIDLPRREQYEVLCIIHFLYLRSTLRFLSTTPCKRNRLSLLWMALVGAREYYTLKFRLALRYL